VAAVGGEAKVDEELRQLASVLRQRRSCAEAVNPATTAGFNPPRTDIQVRGRKAAGEAFLAQHVGNRLRLALLQFQIFSSTVPGAMSR